MGNQKYWAAVIWFCMKLVMFALARIPGRGWCPRCCGIYWHQTCWCWCIRLLFAGLWCFVQGICSEMLKPWDFLSLSEQSVQRIQLCVLGRICWVIGFNGELVEWGWGEKRKQECFSELATPGEAALLILWLITIFEIPSSLCDWEKELIAMTVYSFLASEALSGFWPRWTDAGHWWDSSFQKLK